MSLNYTYRWFNKQFEQAKIDSEKFLLSVDEAQFLQPPAADKWCVAECYSHLYNFGMLYYNNLAGELSKTTFTENDGDSFPPRWYFKLMIRYFEPPYKMKIKTFEQMKPDSVVGFSRVELLDRFINLQEQFITLLVHLKSQNIDLGTSKVPHPIFPWLKLTLSECFALILAHQRRHKWQAEQALNAISGSARRSFKK